MGPGCRSGSSLYIYRVYLLTYLLTPAKACFVGGNYKKSGSA